MHRAVEELGAGMSEWIEKKLGQFAPFHYGKSLPEKDREPGEVPVLSSAGVTGTHDKPLVNVGGIVVGRKGTVGSVWLTKVPFWAIDTAFYIRDDPQHRDLRFTYYLLLTLGLGRMNSDSAVPGLNRDHAHDLTVRIPQKVEDQRAIANVLGTLDDKIELNRRMNETLEAIARAIFQSWFVDFDPVRAKANGEPVESICQRLGLTSELLALFPDSFEDSELGEIPKGWRVRNLDDVASFLNGLALQKYPVTDVDWLPVIKIAQLRSGSTVSADRASTDVPTDYVIQDGDVLFSWSGSLEVEIWCGGKGALNQHLFKVASDEFPRWFYFLWTRHHLPSFREIAADKATTMGHIQRKHLTAAKTVCPPSALLGIMSRTIDPLIQKAINCRLESQKLAETRDALLPQLLSGKMSVSSLAEET